VVTPKNPKNRQVYATAATKKKTSRQNASTITVTLPAAERHCPLAGTKLYSW